MSMRSSSRIALAIAIPLLLAPIVAHAQIEESLESYTENNAAGYLEPFRDTLASGLGSGLYATADVDRARPYFRLGAYVMLVGFSDEDRTFLAEAEDYFPGTGGPYEAPTVIGDSEGSVVEGPGGTSFQFPGGLDLDRLPVAAPQITVGGVLGSEVTLRWFSGEFGDTEIGDVSLFGLGLRHSISQYLPASPVAIAGSFAYQTFEIGNGLVDFSQTTFGVQASKAFPVVEPYAGLNLHMSSMSSEYTYTAGDADRTIEVDFDDATQVQLILGLNVRLLVLNLTGEVGIGDQTTTTLGLTLGL